MTEATAVRTEAVAEKTAETATQPEVVLAVFEGKRFTTKDSMVRFLYGMAKHYREATGKMRQPYKLANYPLLADQYENLAKKVSAMKVETLVEKAPWDLARSLAAAMRTRFVKTADLIDPTPTTKAEKPPAEVFDEED